LKNTSEQIIRTGGADFMVAQKGAADLSFSIVSEADSLALSQHAAVERAEGILFHITRVGSNPFFVILGRPSQALVENITLVTGRAPALASKAEILLGVRAAKALDAEVGDVITIDRRTFTVVGIYESDSLWEDGGAYLPLETVQEMASKSDVLTAVFITLRPGLDVETAEKQIEAAFPNLAVVASVSDYSEVDQGIRILDAANYAISFLAVGIGAIGVMNTMIMSVFERTREIGILRAVGWSGSRILRMIVTESLLLCTAAAGFGTLLGVGATRLVMVNDTIRNLLEPTYSLELFLKALIVAVGVALLGAAYPALRAVRLTPMEALRYG
jgi:putative ABC transport system permease protein